MRKLVAAIVNGHESNDISLDDRGLQYGDGVFETIAVRQGDLRLWSMHMQRLAAGCRRLGIPQPDQAQLRFEAEHLVKGCTSCVLKIIITRGCDGRGYMPAEEARTTRIVCRKPWPDYSQELTENGIRVAVCETRIGRNPQLAGIKHLNRLEQVLASRELQSLQADEGLLRDSEGCVIEGTRSNLFVVINNQVLTADLGQCGVAGVMRSAVLDSCRRLRLPSLIQPLALDDLDNADELFVTNSLMGVCPVTHLGSRALPVGSLTRRLQAAVADTPEDASWHP